jgi:predicted ATPase
VSKEPISAEVSAPRGLYIWGGVGCGKTMLMDLFMHHVREVHKTRVHFNSFMQSVHQQIHQYRTQHQVLKEDPLDYVVQQIRAQTQLLCFDEFQVTNIADAMLLGRLFDKLWQRHVIVVATSNRPPDGTYTGHRLTPVTCHTDSRVQISTRVDCSAHSSCRSLRS